MRSSYPSYSWPPHRSDGLMQLTGDCWFLKAASGLKEKATAISDALALGLVELTRSGIHHLQLGSNNYPLGI